MTSGFCRLFPSCEVVCSDAPTSLSHCSCLKVFNLDIHKTFGWEIPSVPNYYITAPYFQTINFGRRNVKIASQKSSWNYLWAPQFLQGIWVISVPWSPGKWASGRVNFGRRNVVLTSQKSKTDDFDNTFGIDGIEANNFSATFQQRDRHEFWKLSTYGFRTRDQSSQSGNAPKLNFCLSAKVTLTLPNPPSMPVFWLFVAKSSKNGSPCEIRTPNNAEKRW